MLALRIGMIVVAAIGLSGCASMFRAISNVEDVDMVTPERLDEAASGAVSRFGDTAHEARDKLRGENTHEKASTYLRMKAMSRRLHDTTLLSTASPVSLPEPPASVTRNGDSNEDKPVDVSGYDYSKVTHAYFESGIALSDLLCSEWLDRIMITRIATEQSNDWLASTNAAAGAILGFTQTPSHVIGIVSSAFGYGQAVTTDTMENYLLRPDLGELDRSLKNYRVEYASRLEAAETDLDYFRATSALERYHDTCTPRWIKSFINQAIAGAEPTDGNLDAPFLSRLAVELRKYFADGVPELSTSDVVDLYILLVMETGKENEEAVKAIKKRLKDAKIMKDDKDLALKDPAKKGSLIEDLKTANSSGILKRRAEQRLKELKGKGDGPAPAAENFKNNATTKAMEGVSRQLEIQPGVN